MLLDHFVALAAAELGHPVELAPEAIAAAVDHAWPGNVRALRNAVLRAAALAAGPDRAITSDELVPPADSARSQFETISVPRGSYARMHAALIHTVVAEEGSIRKAARVLDVPRSTLGAWLRREPDVIGMGLGRGPHPARL